LLTDSATFEAKVYTMSSKVKGLSLFALTMIAIGATIGSGIFKTPSDIARQVFDSKAIMILWILGGVVSLLGALVFAELGSRMPQAGGVYTYLKASYGPLPAFLYGWCLLTVISSGTIAALCVVFAEYLNNFLGFASESEPYIAMTGIVVLTLFNTFGIKSSEWFANISTVLKIVGIYALLILTIFLGDKLIFGKAIVVTTDSSVELGSGVNYAVAFVSVLWSYTGWHYASFVAGSATNPKRDIPLAMLFGTGIVTLTYVLCNAGYLKALDLSTIQSSNVVASDALEAVQPGLGSWISALIAISVFGCAGLYILSTPRIFHQMSNEGVFFKIFSKSHKKFGVPVNAIILQSGWAILLVSFWGKFESIITYVTFVEWLFLLLACTSIFIVRFRISAKKKDSAAGNEEKAIESKIFKTPLYPLVPILFVVIVGWFISKNIFAESAEVYAGLLVLPFGILFYYIFKGYSIRESGPKNEPLDRMKH
jgi:APA family basic amino acid/polyamine antiporter